MNHRARVRLLVGVVTAIALVLIVLYPPWLVVRVTPQGADPLRVEFSFLFGGGPKRLAGGMYPQRTMVKTDWLALEIAAVVVVGGVLLLLVPGETGRRGRATRVAPPGGSLRAPRPDRDLEPHPEYQSSPGESFEQHATRLERVWRTPMPTEASQSASRASGAERPEPPAPEPQTGPDGGDLEPQSEYQSSPGEPFDQHAQRLKRVWRPQGDGEKLKEPEGKS